MAKRAPRPIIDLLGGFLRRNAASLSDEELQARMDDLATARAKAPDSTSPFALPDAEATAVPEGAIVAAELGAPEVRERLARLTEYVAAQVRAGELPHLDLPDLHRNNTVYDERGDVFLGHGVRRLAFDRQGCKPLMRILLALETASHNLRDGIFTTKRGLFYAHRASLPEDDSQLDTDRALTALANVLRVRRRALGFVAARRGSVFGRVVLRRGSEVIDFAQPGTAGSALPPFVDDFEIVESDAAVIAVIEKDSVAARLAQEQWWQRMRCIMVCSSGFPSMSTRELVRKLIHTLRIPAVVVGDADPGGIQLALAFAHGSISSALETPWLACPGLSWAGFWPSEIERLGQKHQMIQLSAEDQEAARMLLAHPSRTYVNDRVRNELSALLDQGSKIELDALLHESRLGDYLYRKIRGGDVIPL